jgi:hypothetical protein
VIDDDSCRCSHCGKPVNKDADGLTPYHDWPKPTRQVCPGSKQKPVYV